MILIETFKILNQYDPDVSLLLNCVFTHTPSQGAMHDAQKLSKLRANKNPRKHFFHLQVQDM